MSSVRERQRSAGKGRVKNGATDGMQQEKSTEENGNPFWVAIQEWDEKYTAMCAVCANKDSRLRLLRPLMKLIEISCHGIPWLFGTTLMLLSVHQAFHVEILVNLFYGLVLDLIVIVILKLTFRRSRPKHNEMDMFVTVSVDLYSFPSGHASRAGMLACFFVLEYFTSRKWITIMLSWSLIVALSRVVLGRHHLIDIICGYFVGILEYLLLLYLWVPRETCMSWLELYFSHFHL